MENYVLLKNSKELQQLSKELGFSTLYTLDEIAVIKEENKKKLMQEITKAHKQQKKALFVPKTEELLRHALEKTNVDLILGIEKINPKDSMHYVRGALDQVTAKIAADKKKTICFSLSDIMENKNKARILARMQLNLKLCKKYKVNYLFSNFATKKHHLRSTKDLQALKRAIEKSKF